MATGMRPGRPAFSTKGCLKTRPYGDRTVGSDGSLGGYQGGASKKRALLEMDGILFDAAGHIRPQHWFYADTVGMKT